MVLSRSSVINLEPAKTLADSRDGALMKKNHIKIKKITQVNYLLMLQTLQKI